MCSCISLVYFLNQGLVLLKNTILRTWCLGARCIPIMQETPVQEQRFAGFYFTCSAVAGAKEFPVARYYKGL